MSHKIGKERVLLLTPTPADAMLSENILREAGLPCHVCNDIREVSRELRLGAGAVLLTEEVYSSRDVFYLVEAVRGQDHWSDIPILLLSSSGADSPAAAWAMEMLGNVTVLERPIRVTTLVSALRAALRARRRQYQLHDQVEALRKSEERLRLAIEFGQLGLWEWNIEADEIQALHVTRDLPAPATRLTTKESLEFIYPEDRDRVLDSVQAALRDSSRFDAEFRLQEGGTLRWLASKGEVIRDPHGQPLRMLGVNYDITARKQSEEALREADRRKDKFLATLAHELRNPLAPIRNALQVMRLAPHDAAMIDQARVMMERQLSQMVRLIDDLLDVSRISTGKLELRKERVLLRDIVNNAVDTARPVIETARHHLHITLPDEPVYLDADPVRLAQVFSNLLNNAAKYTDPSGHIWLEASCSGELLQVSVRDTGMGIPSEALSSVFEMFTQLDPSLSKSQGGLGIGLMLVKQLLDLHGGTIEARSDGVGKGAEFIVRIPTAEPPPMVSASRADERLDPATRRCRVLIADDNVDAAESMGMMLEMLGNEVRTVYDGMQAFKLAGEFEPDLVLLDIGMPLMNGYETARHIREQPWGKDIYLVAITGWGQEGDKRQAAQAGFDRHFTKPVLPSDVIELIAEVRGGVPRNTRAQTAQTATSSVS